MLGALGVFCIMNKRTLLSQLCVQCKGHISQGHRGGRQQPVPGHQRASRVNRHPQMCLTLNHPESTHCQERFRNPPATHAVGAQDHNTPDGHLNNRPERATGHRTSPSTHACTTPHHGHSPGRSVRHATTRPHTPQLRPVPCTTTNGLRPPTVSDTVFRHPGCLSDSLRPPSQHECTLHVGTGRAHIVIWPGVHAGPRNMVFCIWQPIRSRPVHMAWDREA